MSLAVVHRTVDVGLSLHYAEVEGLGRPLLFIHGIGMDWRVWQAMLRRFSPAFHLYAVDLRGHGDSDKPAHGYTLADYAVDIQALLEALQLRNAVLVGSSLGGTVAAAVEVSVETVTHRVLVDPPLTGGPVRDPQMYRDILRLKHAPKVELEEYLAVRNPGAGRHLMQSMSAMWHRASDGVITDMLASSATYFALKEQLCAIPSPTLLMQADPARGAVLTDDAIAETLALLRYGSAVRVAGASHAIHGTKPEEFQALVTSFVEQSDDRGGA